MAGLDGKDLANNEDNLKPTDRSINRSMGKQDMEEYLQKIEAQRPERQARIKELKSRSSLSDKERKELNKLEKLEDIDPVKMREENQKARDAYNQKINRTYYTSPGFAVDMARAAGKRGTQMGARQALGFVFAEIWFAAKEELQRIPKGCDIKEIFEAVGKGVKQGFENAKTKYKEIYASVVQTGKVLLFNPDNLRLGDRIKAATVIMATGASVLVGTAVGELIHVTPIGAVPMLGNIVEVFCSSMVSGLISCSLLICLDRSKFINKIISTLNADGNYDLNEDKFVTEFAEAIGVTAEDVNKQGDLLQQYLKLMKEMVTVINI